MPEQTASPEPAANPKYVVDDSPLKASLITVMSLMFFGVMLAGAVLRLASAHDLNGIRALMMRDDTIGWAITFWTVIGAPVWLWIRSKRSWFKKTRDVEIADASPIAKLKSQVVADSLIPPPPPTRAREMTTRLVDPIVLHRVPANFVPGSSHTTAPVPPAAAQTAELSVIADSMRAGLDADQPVTSYYQDRDALQATIDRVLNPSTPAPAVDFLETTARKVEFDKPTVVTSRHLDQFLHGLPVDGAADVPKDFILPGSTTATVYATNLEPLPVPAPSEPLVVPAPDPAPPSPDLPAPPRQTFDQVEHEFATSGSQDSFLDYLAAKGWRYDEGKRAWVGPGTPPPADED
jgi:hypothetical protein